MKRPTINWPNLLNDGGWRQQQTGGYWPRYFRRYHGQRQIIRHWPPGLCWALWVDGKKVASGSLTPLLTLASATAAASEASPRGT